MRQAYVYIMTNKYRTTFYIGVTNNLQRRVFEHQSKLSSNSFVCKYNLFNLVYYEVTDSITDAIRREKQLKNWHQEWKLDLIRTINPELEDLSNTF